ncbi:hypothetical protein S83_055099, partial [Arachis hypogaea]
PRVVEFWMIIESAIESQRQNELLVGHDTLHSMLELELHTGTEKHGRNIYTHKNFYIFQNELWSACVDYGVEGTNENYGKLIFNILDNGMVNNGNMCMLRKALYCPSNHTVHCSCKMFEFKGIPCRHVLLWQCIIGVRK